MVTMAEAHLQMENYATEIEWADKALREANAIWIPAALNIIAYTKLDRSEEAKQAALALIARFPSVTLASIGNRWEGKWFLGKSNEFGGALRETGLPEK